MESLAEKIAYVGRMLFERRLTDFAGGNISAREGSRMLITPRYSGSIYHWNLNADQILSGEVESDELLDNPAFSREGKAHLSVYRAFPEVQGIIHAHPFHVQPFAAACKPIEPVLEATQKFGVIDLVEAAPAHTMDLANHIVAGFKGKEERIRKQATAVLLPKHGIFVAGKDLFSALDALERIDWNAWCILARRMMPGDD
jgi:L-fuculose-phosphate aldolase